MTSIIFIFISLALLLFAFYYANNKTRCIAGLWVVSYFITTMIGAIYLGLPQGVTRALNHNFIEDNKLLMFSYDFKYWVLVFGPILTIALAILLSIGLSKIIFLRKLIAKINFKVSKGIKPFPLSFSIAICTAIILTLITTLYAISKGFSLSPLHFIHNTGNYENVVHARYHYFSTFSYRFWGIIYTLLPSLTIFSLYLALKNKAHRLPKVILTILLIIFIIYFNAMTFQKLPAMVIALFTTLTVLYLKKLKLRYYFIFFSIGLILFVLYQSLSVNELSSTNFIKTIVFRSGVNPAYYRNVYPEIINYEGFDFTYLNRFGLGKISLASNHIHEFAFPEVQTKGFMPAAFHIAAYAENGIIYSLIISFVIFSAIFIILNFIKPKRSIYDFGVFFGLAWFSYYLTQVQFRDAAFGSYGLQWVLLAVIVIAISAILNYIFKLLRG